MHIVVCISHVPDTTTKIRFNKELTQLDSQGVKWVINPWDDLTLTRALDMKEASGGKIAKVSVIHVGDATTEPTLRKALAMGADEAIRVDAVSSDSYSTASHLAASLKDLDYDLVLCGIESSDYNSSAVGGMLAEILDLYSVSSVSAIELTDEGFVVKREQETGKETLRVSTPFVAIGQKGIAIDPRIPSMRGVMSARTKPLKVMQGESGESYIQTTVFEYPEPKGSCRFFQPNETDQLADALRREAKVI
ncbi:MAG: electron transfer flavoprotein beta subunit/FixA family protein [Bacteroidetes bacterium]|nr:MAG: electron transfer flavoprotein beta subunit/FixA family protein [Bacteroidota bacterium]